MEMAPKLVQHRLQLLLRIAAGPADASCGLAQYGSPHVGLIAIWRDQSYQLDQMARDTADDLATARASKPQLVSRFAAVLLSAYRTLFSSAGKSSSVRRKRARPSVVGE